MANIQRSFNQLLGIAGGITALSQPSYSEAAKMKKVKSEQQNVEDRLEGIYMSDEANREGQEGSLIGTRYEEEEHNLAKKAVQLQEERAEIDPAYGAKLMRIKEKRGETVEMTRLKGIEEAKRRAEEAIKNEERRRAFFEGTPYQFGTPGYHVREVIK